MNDSTAALRRRGFEERLRPHLRALRGYARRLCINAADAEDLIQDVLLKLYEKSERLAEVQELRPWLMRVTYYRFIDGCRRRDTQMICYQHELNLGDSDDDGPDFAEHVPTSEPGPEALAEHAQLRDWLESRIARLPAGQRDVIDLHELRGLSLVEIAQTRHISVNTLKSSLSRARVNLRGHGCVAGEAGAGLGQAFAERRRGYGSAHRRRRNRTSRTSQDRARGTD